MSAAPLPPVEPRARRRRRGLLVGVFIAVIAAGVVLVAATDFVAPELRPGVPVVQPGVLQAPDYRNASFALDRPRADALALNLSGGPWQLVGGRALTAGQATAVPLAATGSSDCPMIPNPYDAFAAVPIPAQYLVDGRGQATLWTYDYVGAGGVGLRIEVDNGTATVLGHLDFNQSTCAPPGPSPVLVGTGAIDSTTAGLDALNLGGAAFLSDNPSASVTYSLQPRVEPNRTGGSVDQWNITYDGCGTGFSGSLYSPFGDMWNVWLDAASGDLEASHSSIVSCPEGLAGPIPYPLSEALGLNAPVRTVVGGTLFLNASIDAVCCGLTLENLSAELHPVGTAAPPTTATIELTDAAGDILCKATSEGSGGFDFGCPEALAIGDLFSVQLPAAGTGELDLTLDGLWVFAGEVDVPLASATAI